MRIHIIGLSGAGKTTLARQLATHLTCVHVELDALYWGPDWTITPTEVFQQRVSSALRHNAWSVDGNYSVVRQIIWSQADMVLWLDYSLSVILRRLLWRSLKSFIDRREFRHSEDNNRWRYPLDSQSLVLRTIRSYHRLRRTYEEEITQSAYSHLEFIRFTSPDATKYWLKGFEEVAVPRTFEFATGKTLSVAFEEPIINVAPARLSVWRGGK